MNQIALITGADRGLGFALTKALLEQGWTVVAGQYIEWPELGELSEKFSETLHIVPMDVGSDESVKSAAAAIATKLSHIDLLISNAGINRSAHVQSIREELNSDDILAEFSVNAIGALRLVHTFLPFLERGTMKRLCFVSSEAGSIGASTRTGWFGYCMSKAALNMAVKNLHNDLSLQGFSFRLYQPGWMSTYMRGTKNLEAPMEPEEGAMYALKHFLDANEPLELSLKTWEGKLMQW